MTTANDYDRYAVMRQEELQKGTMKAHHFVEKPAMKSILPNLNGKRILLLGCGTGEETVLLEEFGANDMMGIDISEESIEIARKTYPKYQFQVGDMHDISSVGNTFDFVYSSLAVHYSATPDIVLKEVFRVLKPGGQLQFSVTHPIRWASDRITIDSVTTKVLGYTEGDSGVKLYGNYSDYKEYSETFPSGEVLNFYVGPPSLWFKLLRGAGFQVDEFIETRAIEETKKVDERYYQRFNHFPQFTIFLATKPI